MGLSKEDIAKRKAYDEKAESLRRPEDEYVKALVKLETFYDAKLKAIRCELEDIRKDE